MDNIITENLRGFKIQFETKAGVFSKVGLDGGTRLLIENMDIKNGTLVADLGCGGGVIGFVAAKLNPEGYIHLLDSDLRVTSLAEQNSQINKLKNVEVFLSDLFSAVGPRTYHQILSNIPQHMGNQFLEEATEECFNHLKPGGELLWVVQKHVKPVIERLFKKYFGNFEVVAHGKIHVVLKAVKNG